MSGSVSISSGNENDLQSAVANVGPIAVSVDASSNAFRVSVCVCGSTMHTLELLALTILATVAIRWCIEMNNTSK